MTIGELTAQGYLMARALDDGAHFVAVERLTHGQGRIIVGRLDDPCGYVRGWCYETLGEAVTFAIAWDIAQDAEPTGWVRAFDSSKQGYRRWPDADPDREWFDDGMGGDK